MARKQYLAIEIYKKSESVFSQFLAKKWNFVVNWQIARLIIMASSAVTSFN